MHSFELVGIRHEPFESLFQLSDEQLREQGAVRMADYSNARGAF